MSLQPLHYSTHAAALFKNAAPFLAERWPDYDRFEYLLTEWLERAIVFQLPDNGQLFDRRDYRPEVMDLVRLPYPMMAIEFQADEALYVEESGLARADKRIALAFNPAALSLREREYLCVLTESAVWLNPGPNVLGLLAIYAPRNPEHALVTWGFAPGFLLWDPEQDRPKARAEIDWGAEEPVPEWAKPRQLSEHSLPVAIYPFRTRQAKLGLSSTTIKSSTLSDSTDELGATWDLLAALNCKNVGVTRLEAPAALNKKRLKAGKLPFRDTMFLDIMLDSPARQATRGSQGSHASPRAHLRRGHIRNLPPTEQREARALWINATHVGGVPTQQKPYRVSR